MLDFPRWKTISTALLLAFGVLLAIPSLLPANVATYYPSFLPQAKVNLGLDLQGGSHILLEGDPKDVAAQRLQNMEETVRAAMRSAKPRIGIGDISREGGKLSFLVRDVSQVDAAREAILPLTTGAGLTGQRDWDIEVRDTSRIVLPPASFLHEQEKIKERWPAAIRYIKEHKLNEHFDGDQDDIGLILQGGLYNGVIRALLSVLADPHPVAFVGLVLDQPGRDLVLVLARHALYQRPVDLLGVALAEGGRQLLGGTALAAYERPCREAAATALPFTVTAPPPAGTCRLAPVLVTWISQCSSPISGSASTTALS